MKKYEYKVDSFGCTFSGRNKFTQQLQDMIDKYASDGWTLHSYETPGALGELCVVVFCREVQEKDTV
ncbi:MAG: DUF4177 domain-containing protein [Ruminococcus sp.]|nr:DUF4177 domain-containing protein [Ruminococcus sp.]